MNVKILGTGSYAPEEILTNDYFTKIVDTNDKWIVERTGIKARRRASTEQVTSDLGTEAALRAMKSAGVEADEIDQLIVATSCPDRMVPPAASFVQAKIGCFNAGAFDILVACSGFVYALEVGRALVASGQSKRCLVVGAEQLSRLVNYKDRSTCILFGDGAGAVVLGPSDDDSTILYAKTGSDGRMSDYITTPYGGTAHLLDVKAFEAAQHTLQMKGREVYKFAVPKFVEIILEGVAACDMKLSDVDLIIPHQMNLRMIEAVAQRLEYPMDKIYINIQKYGNTSAASIPLALDEAIQDGRVKKGDIILFSAMGAGISWGTVVLRW